MKTEFSGLSDVLINTQHKLECRRIYLLVVSHTVNRDRLQVTGDRGQGIGNRLQGTGDRLGVRG